MHSQAANTCPTRDHAEIHLRKKLDSISNTMLGFVCIPNTDLGAQSRAKSVIVTTR
jgi:hypothetical protein